MRDLTILIGLSCLVGFSTASIDALRKCKDILQNPSSALDLRNLCIRLKEGKLISNDEEAIALLAGVSSSAGKVVCGPLHCSERCVFGSHHDKKGCPTCKCVDPLEDPKYLWEADIMLAENTKDYLEHWLDGKSKANGGERAAANFVRKWDLYRDGDKYVMPYEIDGSISEQTTSAILDAARVFEEKTCISLQPRQAQHTKYVQFFDGGGCWSYVGRTSASGAQQISLASGCGRTGIVQHEVLHALGFFHEQSRPDRDNYVIVHSGNIATGKEHNFNKYGESQIDSYGSDYDISSVMHYSSYSFSSNGQPTITDLNNNAFTTQRDGLSESDIFQLREMYDCQSPVTTLQPTNPPEPVTTTTLPPEPVTTTTTPDCPPNLGGTISDEGCAWLALYGQCGNNCVQGQCCRTCQALGDCANQHFDCDGWAKDGMCTDASYGAWMAENCKHSCNLCPARACLDTREHCAYWASLGYCDNRNYANFMRDGCKSSCNVC